MVVNDDPPKENPWLDYEILNNHIFFHIDWKQNNFNHDSYLTKQQPF